METVDEILQEFGQGFILEEQVKQVKKLLEKQDEK
jgi:hypothetical protein